MTQVRWRLGWILATLVALGFLGAFFAWPAATLILRGFHSDSGWTLAGFSEVFSSARTWRAVGFTLASASVSTVLCLALGIPGAYLLYKVSFRGRSALRAAIGVPFVLPTVVVGVAFGALLREDGLLGWTRLAGTPAAIIAAMVFFNVSVVVRTVGAMWSRIDSRLSEASAALGTPPRTTLRRVTLPTLAPAIVSAASLVFLFSASSYGIVMVLGQGRYQSIETEIWFLTTQLLDLRGAAALSITQLIIVTLALWLSSSMQARTTRALKLQPPAGSDTRLVLSRDWVAVLVTAACTALLIITPLGNLVWRSLHRGGTMTLENYMQLGSQVTMGTTIWSAVQTSVVTAVAATAIAVSMGLLVALLASRRPASPAGRRGLATLEALFLLPLGVSAVTVGFGYLITLNRPPLDLRSSVFLIPIAQAVVALPLVVRILLPVLRAIDPRQLEAAGTLGAEPLEVLLRIELPHLRRAMGLAVGFAFATSLGEFGATSFLARPDRPTLPVLIFRLFGRPGADTYGMALAASVLLAGLAGVVMAIAERVRPEEVSTW